MATYRNNTNSTGTLGAKPVSLHGNELIRGLTGEPVGGGGSTGGKKSSGSGGGDAPVYYYSGPVQTVDQTERLQGLLGEMYKTTFEPQTVDYTATPETELSSQIASWLLPGYERAISERREKTLGYAAELDADAISRGMGSSTYVTDVKSRQQRDEANDIAILQSEYGATLAKNVSERLSQEKERSLTADMFNAEARQKAYELAYQAAVLLMGLGAVAHETEEEEEA